MGLFGDPPVKPAAKSKRDHRAEAVEVLAYLSEASGVNRKPVNHRGDDTTHLKDVIWFLRKGYTRDECREVIDFMVPRWVGTSMAHLLVPKTLFRRHGARYLEEWREVQANPELAEVYRARRERDTGEGSGKVKPAAEVAYERDLAERLSGFDPYSPLSQELSRRSQNPIDVTGVL